VTSHWLASSSSSSSSSAAAAVFTDVRTATMSHRIYRLSVAYQHSTAWFLHPRIILQFPPLQLVIIHIGLTAGGPHHSELGHLLPCHSPTFTRPNYCVDHDALLCGSSRSSKVISFGANNWSPYATSYVSLLMAHSTLHPFRDVADYLCCFLCLSLMHSLRNLASRNYKHTFIL